MPSILVAGSLNSNLVGRALRFPQSGETISRGGEGAGSRRRFYRPKKKRKG